MIAKLVLSASALVAGAVVFHVTPADPPYVMVDELTAAHDRREVRVHGWVVAGTIRESSLGLHYQVQRNGKQIHVLQRTLEDRDLLKDQSEVVVRGMLVDDVLVADSARMKCSSYRERQPGDTRFE